MPLARCFAQVIYGLLPKITSFRQQMSEIEHSPVETKPEPPPGRLKKTVVMVGMMGAGKTAVGRALALRLGVPFLDSDAEIESAANMTVPEIFARDGEPFFRRKESQVIARLLEEERGVLSTGGGAFLCRGQPPADLGARRVGLAEGRSRGALAPGPAQEHPPAAAHAGSARRRCARSTRRGCRSMPRPTWWSNRTGDSSIDADGGPGARDPRRRVPMSWSLANDEHRSCRAGRARL